MDKIQLKILGISAGNISSSYTLILEEVSGERKLPIIIGVLEAQAIAIELEKIAPVRPMTHDLFKSFSVAFDITVQEVIIHKLFEGIFYAYLVATDGKEVKNIDSRTSDAIAIALRFNCPIYTYENIMTEAGVSLKSFSAKEKPSKETKESVKQTTAAEKDDDLTKKDYKVENLRNMPIAKLKKLLKNAVAEEDYILAAKIRDAIRNKEEETGSDEI
jgi:uncharacterized protein